MLESRESGCRTLVVSRGKRQLAAKRYLVVRTPLDMIKTLEENREAFNAVVLTGRFAKNIEIVSFLHDAYPSLKIVSGKADEEPDTYLPAFA